MRWLDELRWLRIYKCVWKKRAINVDVTAVRNGLPWKGRRSRAMTQKGTQKGDQFRHKSQANDYSLGVMIITPCL